MKKSVVKYFPVIPGRVCFRYENIGHGLSVPRNLLWWWDGKSDYLNRRQDRGGTFHCVLVPDIVDEVWRGRVEVSTGRASILPTLSVYAHTEPDKILVPVSLVRRLRRLGGVYFYVDTKGGVRRVETDAVVIAKTDLGRVLRKKGVKTGIHKPRVLG